jgi:hypothetical protein
LRAGRVSKGILRASQLALLDENTDIPYILV